MPGKAPRVDAVAWDRHKEEIISLYRESSLKQTMIKMQQEHGFRASQNQYRARLKAWNISKHATADVWVFINDRMKKRRRAGKGTDVVLYGELQPPRKVAKEIARNVTIVDSLQDLSDVPTPDGVEILTPCAADPIENGTVDISQTRTMSYSEFVGLVTPWIVGTVVSRTPLSLPDPPGQLVEMLRWCTISPFSVAQSQSLSSDLTKYLANKRFAALFDFWGNEYACIRFPGYFEHIELRKAAKAVLLMVHVLLYESSNIHDQLEPSDAVFILRDHFPSAIIEICELKTSSAQVLTKTFLDAAVARGDIAWTKTLLKQGVLPYSNVHLLEIALSSRNSSMINLLWKSGFALHITPRDFPNMHKDARFVCLWNLSMANMDWSVIFNNLMSTYNVHDDFWLHAANCYGVALVEAASEGKWVGASLILLNETGINRSWLGVALQAATTFRHLDMAENLIKLGADIHTSRGFGYPVLRELESGSPHAETMRQGMTPIQIAAENDDIDLVNLLLYHGADANSCPVSSVGDMVYQTPLQYATQNCNFDMVQALLAAGSHSDSGVDITQAGTPLQISIIRDDERIYSLLLSLGADFNSRPARTDGCTALQAAAGTGNVAVAQMLLQKEAFLNAPPGEDRGMTALQAAAFNGHTAMIEMLVAKGADINAHPAPTGGMTALQAAAAGGHHEIVKTLIWLGADVKAPTSDHDGKTALEAAVPHRDLALLETLITQGAEINTERSSPCDTALEIAARVRWLEGARYLLQHGAKVNAHIERNEGHECAKALSWALKNNDYQVVQLLLDNGADLGVTSLTSPCALSLSLSEKTDPDIIMSLFQRKPDMERAFTYTPYLTYAILSSYPDFEVYKLLLDKLAVLPKSIWSEHIRVAWDDLCVHHVLKRTNAALIINIIDLLLKAGVDIDRTAFESVGSCLQAFLARGAEDIAQHLLSRGANANAHETPYYGTPLQEAVAHGCCNIIPKLVQSGADVNAAPCLNTHMGMTALQIAAHKGLMNVARILLEAGADVTASRMGMDAIRYAVQKGRLDMVALLLKSLPIDADVVVICDREASEAEIKNYTELAQWLREYPAARGRRVVEV